jgi:hypothetical protein
MTALATPKQLHQRGDGTKASIWLADHDQACSNKQFPSLASGPSLEDLVEKGSESLMEYCGRSKRGIVIGVFAIKQEKVHPVLPAPVFFFRK